MFDIREINFTGEGKRSSRNNSVAFKDFGYISQIFAVCVSICLCLVMFSCSKEPEKTEPDIRKRMDRENLMYKVENLLIQYGEKNDSKALKEALSIMKQAAPNFPNNTYGWALLAYIHQLDYDPNGERNVLQRIESSRLALYRYFFLKPINEVIPYFKIHISELCQERLQGLSHDLHTYAVKHNNRYPRDLTIFGNEFIRYCPISGEEYDYRWDDELKPILTCKNCSQTPRASLPVVPNYHVFEQLTWVSYGSNRIDMWLPPNTKRISLEEYLALVGMKEGLAVADIGAGDGYFSFPIARLVGDKGMVYCTEIEQPYLDFLDFARNFYKLSNMKFVLSEPNDTKLPATTIDLAYICEVYKSVCPMEKTDDREYLESHVYPFLRSVLNSLKPDGRMVVVDHNMFNEKSVTLPDIIKKQAQEAGFVFDRSEDYFMPHQAILFFKKPA